MHTAAPQHAIRRDDDLLLCKWCRRKMEQVFPFSHFWSLFVAMSIVSNCSWWRLRMGLSERTNSQELKRGRQACSPHLWCTCSFRFSVTLPARHLPYFVCSSVVCLLDHRSRPLRCPTCRSGDAEWIGAAVLVAVVLALQRQTVSE